MPRQFSFRGDRLAYSWGIVLLAGVAFLLLWAFGGDTQALIPLYSVGVFVCFTVSQSGMVRHWLTQRSAGWRWRMGVNATGAVSDGGRPRHRRVREVRGGRLPDRHHRPGPGRDDAVHPSPVRALAQGTRRPPGAGLPGAAPRGARGRADPGRQPGGHPGHQRRPLDRRRRPGGLHHRGPESATQVRADFERQIPGVPLVVVESPYRALVGPLLAYLDVLDAAWPPGRSRRSRSSSSRNTSRAIGGSASSTTRPPSGFERSCSGGR